MIACSILFSLELEKERKKTRIPVREAAIRSALWLLIALTSSAAIWLFLPDGSERAAQFLAGYFIEESLSIDNLFVFLMLFAYFKIEPVLQQRVLSYGIIGVMVLRGIMIFAGVGLLGRFEFLIYIFGAIVLYSAFKLFSGSEKEFNAEQSRILKWTRRIIPVSNDFHGDRFFIRHSQKWFATPLLVVLVVVEITDFLFAFDSIPAIFSVTREPLIIYGSNILAVLGLRSLYFLLEGTRSAFRFVEKGVALILVFVGLKMIAPLFCKNCSIDTGYSLAVILGILAISITLSLFFPEKNDSTPDT